MQSYPAGFTIDDQTDRNGEVIFHDDLMLIRTVLDRNWGCTVLRNKGFFLYKVRGLLIYIDEKNEECPTLHSFRL